MVYFVIETQVNETGAVNVLPFQDRNDAESKYHEILMYASKSTVKKHGAMICTEDMFIIKSEVYNHESID